MSKKNKRPVPTPQLKPQSTSMDEDDGPMVNAGSIKPASVEPVNVAQEAEAHENSVPSPLVSREERLLKARQGVQGVLEKLLSKEKLTRSSLKQLETQLKPLYQKVQRLREIVNLENEQMKSLWKHAKQQNLIVTEKMMSQVDRLEQQLERYQTLELVLIRQAHLLDTLSVAPSRLLELELHADQTRVDVLENEVMEWIIRGEERYFGVASPRSKPASSINSPVAGEVLQQSGEGNQTETTPQDHSSGTGHEENSE